MNDSHPSRGAATIAANALGIILRVAIPLALLAAGGAAFWFLSKPQEEAKSPPTAAKAIRTRVTTLHREDYTVVVKTNGLVQSHNEVSLSAEVSGLVNKLNPAFEVGAYFSEGDILIELDARDYQTAVDVAQATKLSADAALQLAQETYNRNKELAEKKGVSEALLKQSFAEKEQARAQLNTATAQLERAERDLERTVIRAPFDGRVRQKTVGIGQQVGAGAPLGVVFSVDFAEVRLPIPSREQRFLDLPESQSDPPVEVELRDAIDNDSNTVWHAKILRTEGTLDADSLVLYAIARINDPFGRQSGDPPLRIGQPVIASIPGRTLTNVVAIPRPAVRQLDQIYLVNDLKLTNMKVEAVWTDEDHLIINDPSIEDGQLLATTRIVYAPDGAKIEIIPELELTTSIDSDAKTITKSVAKSSSEE